MRSSASETDVLFALVAERLASGESPDAHKRDLVRLARTAERGTDAWVFAHEELAQLAAPEDPWRASLLARRLVQVRPSSARGWAVLGLAQSLLGHHRYAIHAYERALAIEPRNPYFAHNLGHLYDVEGDPRRALRWLRLAAAALPAEAEVHASLAHALARVGDLPGAKLALARATRDGVRAEHRELVRFVEQC